MLLHSKVKFAHSYSWEVQYTIKPNKYSVRTF